MKNRLREELEAMLELHTGDSFTADNVHTLVNGILAIDEVGGFEYVEYDNDAFPDPKIGDTAEEISGLGPATEEMIHTIFIMPNKETNPDATLMIVVEEKDPDSGSYQYVYIGNINDLPSDVLTESSIINDLTTGGIDKPLSAEQGRTLNSHVNYTTCGSNAEDQVKLIPDSGFELSTHLRLLVKMTNTNTNATPKFNINNTGAKDVWYNGSVASDINTWSAEEVLDVYYNGTDYIATTHGGAQFSTGESVDNIGIDAEPTAGSDNLVKSGGTAAQISQLKQKVIDLENGISDSNMNIVPTTRVAGLKIRASGLTADANAVLYYFSAEAGVAYRIGWTNTSSGIIRICRSSAVPSAGLTEITNYTTKAIAEGGTAVTPSTNCYICVGMDSDTFGVGDPNVTTSKTSGIGLDVKKLKQDVVDINAILDESLIYNEPFDLVNTQICDGSGSRYPAGSLASNQNQKTSLLIPSENIEKIVYSLYAATANAGLAIAFYDSEKVFISGLKSDYTTETTLLSSDFPEGTAYIRISTSVGTGRYAKAYCNKDLLEVANALSAFKKDTDNGIFASLPTYWAVCGDSIAHANHTAMTELSTDDIYRPIDDYTNKPGYSNARSGAYPNYAYHFCKRHRMQWANYGYGGTILGEYIPKYLGENNLLYPFVGTRITQFKDGILWNYISIMFGWNDNMYGPVYQKDKWLSETYGGDIGYPYTVDLIGTEGFATQAQKDACDALGETYFFDAFIGNINDTGKDTWYGAWNYALGYLMKKYPDAKIMIMCPFIGGTDRTNSQKFRASVKAVAEKFGVACFDFNDLEWWYFTTVMNSTPFANPDRQDGRWVKQNGDTTPATIEGFNRARFCADSVHPTPLGYKWIADPIGYTLLQK